MWGTLPMACSFLSILFALFLPDRVRAGESVVAFPTPAHDGVYVQEAH